MTSLLKAIKKQIGWNATPLAIKVLICLIGCLSIMFIALFSALLFGKLGKSTLYNISATSEYYRYTPNLLTAPLIDLRNYRVADNCDSDEQYRSELFAGPSELTFERSLVIHITRIHKSSIRLDLKSDTNQSAALIEDIPTNTGCTSVFIELSKESPIFSAKLVGDIEVGPEPSDATLGKIPLLIAANLTVTDRTLFGGLYQFQPFSIYQGDQITIESETPTLGLLRASFDKPAINSVITNVGGTTSIQKYRGNQMEVQSSFIERIKNDNDLAIALSTLLILLQLFYSAIAYLLRIELLEQVKEEVTIRERVKRRKNVQ
ncbi:hypothetical protein [Vibrio alfacsensis]|uniref:hypothetical protein n=1 Tax=Vibrio TaxID=662 RepID=UPI0040682646